MLRKKWIVLGLMVTLMLGIVGAAVYAQEWYVRYQTQRYEGHTCNTNELWLAHNYGHNLPPDGYVTVSEYMNGVPVPAYSGTRPVSGYEKNSGYFIRDGAPLPYTYTIVQRWSATSTPMATYLFEFSLYCDTHSKPTVRFRQSVR
jgi:hypothetical protein